MSQKLTQEYDILCRYKLVYNVLIYILYVNELSCIRYMTAFEKKFPGSEIQIPKCLLDIFVFIYPLRFKPLVVKASYFILI